MRHPRISQQLAELAAPAASLGFRMPADWEPVSALWLARPNAPALWPGCLDDALAQHAELTAALRRFVPLRVLGESITIASESPFIRDYGPLFVKRDDDDTLALHDFRCGSDTDDLVPQKVALLLAKQLWVHDSAVSGADLEVNGQGTVLVSETCLSAQAPEASPDPAALEAELHAALGTSHAVWLPAGALAHARLVAPDTVVAARATAGRPDHDALARALAALHAARDQAGQKLRVVELPSPEPVEWQYPDGPRAAATSYAEVVFANRALIVPIFGQRTDDEALRTFEALAPERQIVPVPAQHLVIGGGGPRRLTRPQPYC